MSGIPQSIFQTLSKADPTRTLTLRNAWVLDWDKRIKVLQKAIYTLIVEKDVLGLGERPKLLAQEDLPDVPTPQPRAWGYKYTPDKVKEFLSWLDEAEDKTLLQTTVREGTLRPEGEPWSNKYVRSAYQSGLSRAHLELVKQGLDFAKMWNLPGNLVSPSFEPSGGAVSAVMMQPFHADRLALAYTRTFNELKGVTDVMDQQISRELANGIAQGLNPKDIGKNIADRVDKIGKTRGELIARTETINVHQQAALNEYYSVEKNTNELILVEWNATMDSRTRDTHADRNGVVYTKEESYSLIGEPNCRCALLPWVVSINGIPKRSSTAARISAKKFLENSGG